MRGKSIYRLGSYFNFTRYHRRRISCSFCEPRAFLSAPTCMQVVVLRKSLSRQSDRAVTVLMGRGNPVNVGDFTGTTMTMIESLTTERFVRDQEESLTILFLSKYNTLFTVDVETRFCYPANVELIRVSKLTSKTITPEKL